MGRKQKFDSVIQVRITADQRKRIAALMKRGGFATQSDAVRSLIDRAKSNERE